MKKSKVDVLRPKGFKAAIGLIAMLLLMASTSFAQSRYGQLWNTANGYYGTVNASNVDACTKLDTVKGTTAYLSLAFWDVMGQYKYDSARILKYKGSSFTPVPYTLGLSGRGTLSITANAYKGAVNSPTTVLTLEQSPNGVNGWITVPSVSVQTVTPTSTTTATVATMNVSEAYQKYYRLKVTTADTAKINAFWNWNQY